jgi:hypothetical protein
MRGPRSGIGAELVPLVLILACLAGSLGLIVVVHRRSSSRPKPGPAVAVALPTPPAPVPEAKPAPSPVVVPEAPEPQPEPPPPEDPTPKAVARLTSAEAEQLLEASRADRKAAALEEARKAAVIESERWRRRESLVNAQLSTLESKVRKIESEADELAFERDALLKEVDARKAAVIESERWRRRESLVNAQLSTLESKVRKIESEADELAFERDALLKEVDARKAAIAQAKSRPSQAILPHKGPNGTWRRPIVVECTNGMAILQPQGVGFGLLELGMGFGPSSNPFVAAIAREAVRIRRKESPDGAPVVPYIFFLVRPDGVRPYYEARGRLEPLGITFGYELADQDWEVEFPDLDDPGTWDGKVSNRPPILDPRAGIPGNSPEDDNFPNWGSPSRSIGRTIGNANDDFTWPGQKALGRSGVAGGSGPVGLPGSGTGDRSGPGNRSTIGPGGILDGGPRGPSQASGDLPGGSNDRTGIADGLAGGPGVERAKPGRPGEPATFPNDFAPGEFPIDLTPPPIPTSPMPRGTAPSDLGAPGTGATRSGRGPSSDPGPSGGGRSNAGPGRTPNPGSGDPSAEPGQGGSSGLGDPSMEGGKTAGDPGSDFDWPPGPPGGGQGGSRPQAPAPIDGPDNSPPTVHRGPFTRPLAMGVQVPPTSGDPGSTPPSVDGDPAGLGDSSGNRGSGGGQQARRMIGQAGAAGGQQQSSGQPPQGASGIGIGTPSTGTPSSGSPPSGSPSSGSPPSGSPPPGSPPPGSPPSNPRSGSPTLPDLGSSRIIDRRFEIVVVCGPRGVIVQPGGYRVTAEALKDRDGLLKKQMVALVKARRAADTKVILEPKVRFLVQSGGSKTYWAARSQVLLSGLDWPMTTQVADPDSLSILPSEGW